MRKYLSNYLQYIDRLLKTRNISDINQLKAEHLRQIQFMQHERFIHLIVTVLFAILLFIYYLVVHVRTGCFPLTAVHAVLFSNNFGTTSLASFVANNVLSNTVPPTTLDVSNSPVSVPE